jgi:poly(3-hydroxybutyrate) depolymerase
MKLRQALIIVAPALLFAGCLMSRLDTEGGDGTRGGSGNSAGSAGMVGTAGSKAGSSTDDGGEAGGGGDTSRAGTANGGVGPSGGTTAGTDAGGMNAGGKNDGGTDTSGGTDTGGMNAGGNGGSGGSPPNILDVKPSPACGKVAAPQATGSFVKYTMSTSGTKAADATGDPGPWTFTREYYLWLPPGYDNTKSYPLVLQLPGCGGNGMNVYPLTGPGGGAGVDGSVIRVGISPPPNGINHAISPNVGCFDDYEGDDSVDVTFYQKIIDEMKQNICYDENRVFVNGNSSGATLSNQLLCKFAGTNAGYAIRGSITNTGTWRTDASAAPTCNDNPVASMFVHEKDDAEQPFSAVKPAINRAMQVNGCTSGNTYDTAQFSAYKISDTDSTSCKLVKGCPANYPVVVCELPGNMHASHDSIISPGAATLITQLAAP